MSRHKTVCIGILTLAGLFGTQPTASADTPIDLSAYDKQCEVRLEGWDGHLRFAWPTGAGEDAVVTLDLSGQRPLIESMAIRKPGEAAQSIVSGVDPVWFLTVGERRAADEKAPDQQWE